MENRKNLSDKCIHPDCECLDYCEALDPYTKTPLLEKPKQLSKEIEDKLDWYESDEWRIGRMT